VELISFYEHSLSHGRKNCLLKVTQIDDLLFEKLSYFISLNKDKFMSILQVISHEKIIIGETILNNNILFISNHRVLCDDTVYYRCDKCLKEENQKFRSNKKFLKTTVLCYSCNLKQSTMERYGVENISQSKEIKDKKIQSSLKKYGVENISQSKEVKDKKIQSSLKKYGVEYILQSE